MAIPYALKIVLLGLDKLYNIQSYMCKGVQSSWHLDNKQDSTFSLKKNKPGGRWEKEKSRKKVEK